MFRKSLVKIYLITINVCKTLRYYRLPNIYSTTRISFRKTPNFDQKTFITGLGSIRIGENCCFGYKLGGFNYKGSIELQARTDNSNIIIGNRINTNNNVFISSCNKITIGDNTLIGQNVCIMDYEAHGVPPELRKMMGKIGEVVIGENVWIGNNVIILKDSKIGNNAIVAAGAVVSGEFTENVIIGGIPAKIIKLI